MRARRRGAGRARPASVRHAAPALRRHTLYLWRMPLPFRSLLVAVLVAAAALVAPPAAGAAPTPIQLRQGKRPVRDAGIGAVLRDVDGRILVDRVLLGLAAQAAGFAVGDE